MIMTDNNNNNNNNNNNTFIFKLHKITIFCKGFQNITVLR